MLAPHPHEAPRSGGSAPHQLSPRQAEIAVWVARGKSNPEIARDLGLSPRTIDTHIAALFYKLDVSSRGELCTVLSLSNADPAVPVHATSSRKRVPRTAAVKRSTLRTLSARQEQIAALISRGKSSREIAHLLKLSPRTIDTHVAAIFNKLGVSSRSELTVALSSKSGTSVLQPPEQGFTFCALSARQAEIAALVALGKSNREIGAALWLSRRTVEAHLMTLFNKLKLKSRGDLIALYPQNAA
jgi:DNA-binding CsgD family transcriptional regulator